MANGVSVIVASARPRRARLHENQPGVAGTRVPGAFSNLNHWVKYEQQNGSRFFPIGSRARSRGARA